MLLTDNLKLMIKGKKIKVKRKYFSNYWHIKSYNILQIQSTICKYLLILAHAKYCVKIWQRLIFQIEASWQAMHLHCLPINSCSFFFLSFTFLFDYIMDAIPAQNWLPCSSVYVDVNLQVNTLMQTGGFLFLCASFYKCLAQWRERERVIQLSATCQ